MYTNTSQLLFVVVITASDCFHFNGFHWIDDISPTWKTTCPLNSFQIIFWMNGIDSDTWRVVYSLLISICIVSLFSIKWRKLYVLSLFTIVFCCHSAWHCAIVIHLQYFLLSTLFNDSPVNMGCNYMQCLASLIELPSRQIFFDITTELVLARLI